MDGSHCSSQPMLLPIIKPFHAWRNASALEYRKSSVMRESSCLDLFWTRTETDPSFPLPFHPTTFLPLLNPRPVDRPRTQFTTSISSGSFYYYIYVLIFRKLSERIIRSNRWPFSFADWLGYRELGEEIVDAWKSEIIRELGEIDRE